MSEEKDKQGQNSDDLVKDDLILWNRDTMQNNISSYDYDAVMRDDKSLFDLLYELYQRGLVLLSNAPERDGLLMEMVERFGWHRRTHFGDYWNAKAVDSPSNLSYTNNALYFHTDLPYVSAAPPLSALHCIHQTTKGGKSLYVDGFNVVKKLKNNSPEAFDTLKDFHVRFSDEGKDVYGEYSLSYSTPIIKLNEHGRITEFLVSNMVMSECNKDTSPDELLDFYEAYNELMKLLYAPENIVDLYLKPGQIALIQNTRVLHGRTAIEATGEPVKRWLQIMYMDWDMIFSKLRVLQKKLGLDTPYLPEQFNDFF